MLFTSVAHAQRGPAPWGNGISNGEDLTIGLLTFSRGDDIPSWFGHTALYVRDNRIGDERVYNYGMFSFGPDMLAKFLVGKLEFWVGQASFPRTVSIYKSLDRDVRLQTFNLSPERRLEIAKYLDWNIHPDNRYYMYDHYFDNCATRVRDVIDKATGGQFKTANDKPARFNLREHTRRHTQRNAYIDVLLTFWMNDQIDVPIKQWDEMFLPTELEMRVDEMQYVNEAGETVPLVLEKKILYQSSRGAPPEAPSTFWPWALLFGLFVGGAGIGLAFWWQKDREKRAPRVLLGLHQVFVGLLFGIPGLIVPLYLFTEHKITHWNPNILLASPLTFLALPFGVAMMFGSTKALRWNAWCWRIMAASAVVALLIAPFISQDTTIAVAMLAPFNAMMAFAFSRVLADG